MTTYNVRYRVVESGHERTRAFPSMTARSLFVLSFAPFIEIVREWVGSADAPEPSI